MREFVVWRSLKSECSSLCLAVLAGGVAVRSTGPVIMEAADLDS
jgi:hypothetical protein